MSCSSCGSSDGSADGTCARCRVDPPAETAADEWLGVAVADRYEVVELLRVGGMGCVYRARQRMLDRDVAIKFIHRHLAADESAVSRFLGEARAASRLNHPNVVCIHDFGRHGRDLFLAMELVTGAPLSDLLERHEAFDPARIAGLIHQVLAGLGEAHYWGIVHRDVKPDNVMVERGRDGREHVKLIDFGIARIATAHAVTGPSETCGTPRYMAPEQALGPDVGAAADLYSVGVMLFELLTGRLPFDSESAFEIMNQHLNAPRPDPRDFAAVPDALADVCLRAMRREPGERFSDAKTFAEALLRATSVGWSGRARSLFPAGPPTGVRATVRASSSPNVPSARSTMPPVIRGRAPLLGRDADLGWVDAALANDAPGVVVWGRAGIGKSRFAAEVAARFSGAAETLVVRAETRPRADLPCTGLRALIAAARPLDPTDAVVRSGAASRDRIVSSGLRAIFGGDVWGGGSMAPACVAALSWALERLVQRGNGRGVVIVDDADRMDRVSIDAIATIVRERAVPGVAFVLTSEREPNGGLTPWVASRELGGLSLADARRIARHPKRLRRSDDDIEPLWVELVDRWDDDAGEPALHLGDLIEQRLVALAPSERRALQASALFGAASIEQLRMLVAEPTDVERGLIPLTKAGLLSVDDGATQPSHEIIARLALASAPAGTLAEMHERAAEVLEGVPDNVELRAWHAIRGQPDFETFLLVEDIARSHELLGDDEGSVAALAAAVQAARAQVTRGESEASLSAWTVFGRKLSAALLHAGDAAGARSVLDDVLRNIDHGARERQALLDQRATINAVLRREADPAEGRGGAEGEASPTRSGVRARRPFKRAPGANDGSEYASAAVTPAGLARAAKR